MLGVQDIRGTWVKFTGINNGVDPTVLKGGLCGAWQVFCQNEIRYERRDRDRPRKGPGVQPASPIRTYEPDGGWTQEKKP